MVICKDFLEALHESCAQKYRAADCTRGALQVQLIFTFLNRLIHYMMHVSSNIWSRSVRRIAVGLLKPAAQAPHFQAGLFHALWRVEFDGPTKSAHFSYC